MKCQWGYRSGRGFCDNEASVRCSVCGTGICDDCLAWGKGSLWVLRGGTLCPNCDEDEEHRRYIAFKKQEEEKLQEEERRRREYDRYLAEKKRREEEARRRRKY